MQREKTTQVARKLVDRKQYGRALAEYEKLVEARPDDVATLLKIGDIHVKTGAYPDAVAAYARAADVYFARGFASRAVALYQQVRRIIRDQAPELAPRYAQVGARVGELYEQLQQPSEALAVYEDVALGLQERGQDAQAIRILQRMIVLDGQNPLPYLRLAEASCRLNAVEEAVESFWKAAQLLLGMRRRDDALRVIERILHFREVPEYARLAARLYLERGLPSDGKHALGKLLVCFQADPRDLDTLSLLARAFTLIGQARKAVEVYKEMARLAREQGDLDLLAEIIGALQASAPSDPAVQTLGAELRGLREAEAARVMVAEEEAEVDDLELQWIEGAENAEVLVVEDELQAVEEVRGEAFDVRAHTRKALVDAASFRKLGLLAKAEETLRIAVELDASSAPLREQLALVLEETGDVTGALAERVTLARGLFDQGQLTLAHEQLERVLHVDPSHSAAQRLLAELDGATRRLSELDELEGVDELPSYALDDEDAAPVSGLGEADDPFAQDAESGAALPRFSLSEDEGGGADLDAALEEIDFFIGQGLLDEARPLLEAALDRHPASPLLRERLAQLRPAALESSPTSSDELFDIAASLEALDALDAAAGPASIPPPSEVNVDEIFEKFKAGVRAQISESDSATHYDLGVAYKEMGLLPDAIGELELAARDPHRASTCWAMIGVIHMEQFDFEAAVAAYERGLGAETTVEQECTLLYDLAGAEEALGNLSRARECLERIVSRDAGYRDARQRLAELRGPGAA